MFMYQMDNTITNQLYWIKLTTSLALLNTHPLKYSLLSHGIGTQQQPEDQLLYALPTFDYHVWLGHEMEANERYCKN